MTWYLFSVQHFHLASSCIWVVIVDLAFPLLRILLVWFPYLHFLPGYLSISLLLNQYKLQIITGARALTHSTKLCRAGRNVRKGQWRGWEPGQAEKCSSCKHENLSFTPKTHVGAGGDTHSTCQGRVGRDSQVPGTVWPNSLPCMACQIQDQWELYLKTNRQKGGK